jgi:predicted TPR repeat methyltransferase
VLSNKGDLDAATDAYNQATRINPEHADVYFNLGNALSKKGDFDAAIDAFNQAIRTNPEDAFSARNAIARSALFNAQEMKAERDDNALVCDNVR